MNNPTDKTELHSEKIRNLLGEIPSSLIFWSTIILAITFILIVIILSVCSSPGIYSLNAFR